MPAPGTQEDPLAFAAGELGHFLFPQRFDPAEGEDLPVRLSAGTGQAHVIFHAPAKGVGRLGQIAETRPAGEGHAPFVRRERPREQTQQGGFARAVEPDERDALPFFDRKGGDV